MFSIPYELYKEHDELGNAPHLLSPKHKSLLERGSINRVSGDCLCTVCGKKYYDHPQILGALWLNELCDGRLVKLWVNKLFITLHY